MDFFSWLFASLIAVLTFLILWDGVKVKPKLESMNLSIGNYVEINGELWALSEYSAHYDGQAELVFTRIPQAEAVKIREEL